MTPTAGAPSPARYRSTRPIAGISLLIASTWTLSGLDASGKWVMGAGAPLLVLCWVRYVLHLALVAALVLPARGASVLRSVRLRDQILRGLFMLAATLSFFTTLHYLPQAEATAINFLAPLIMLAAAPWLLQEPPQTSRWIAAAIGFMGVLIVVRPTSGLDPTGVIFGLVTACLVAAQSITTRRVAVDHPYTTLLWSGLVGSVCLTFTLPFWLGSFVRTLGALSALELGVLFSTGLWGAVGHLLQIQAYRNAPASMLAPFIYFQIVSAATLGWLLWGDFPDFISWVGIAIICSSGITIGALEWRRKGPPAGPGAKPA